MSWFNRAKKAAIKGKDARGGLFRMDGTQQVDDLTQPSTTAPWSKPREFTPPQGVLAGFGKTPPPLNQATPTPEPDPLPQRNASQPASPPPKRNYAPYELPNSGLVSADPKKEGNVQIQYPSGGLVTISGEKSAEIAQKIRDRQTRDQAERDRQSAPVVDPVIMGIKKEGAARRAAEKEAREKQIQEQTATGTMTVDTARRAGLLSAGLNPMREKPYEIMGPDGQMMRVSQQAYVDYLNAQKRAEIDADANRTSAESIAQLQATPAEGDGLMKGRFGEAQGVDENGVQVGVIYDTATGEQIYPPGKPNPNWSTVDVNEYNKLKGYIKYHQGEIDKGKRAQKGAVKTHAEYLADDSAKLDALINKYNPKPQEGLLGGVPQVSNKQGSGGGVSDVDILKAVPDATREELGEIRALLSQGMKLKEIIRAAAQ